MIHWLIQTAAANPYIIQGQAPPGLLSADEVTVFERFTVLKRREDWLLGRWTAKLLLQEMIRLQHEQIIALDKIVVLPDKEGAPRPAITAGVDLAAAFSLSISHSNGRSLCAAVALAGWPLGADIERIEPRAPNFAADFFTAAEQQQIEACDAALRETLLTAIWSGKEAALKATRQGLRADTRSLTCHFGDCAAWDTASSGSWLSFDLTWERGHDQQWPPLHGWWMVDEGFVLTLVAENGQVKEIAER